MVKELDFMIQRFPQYRDPAERLYSCSDDFKAICEDYWLCSSNLENLKAGQICDNRLLTQYSLLRLDLESEALRLLDSFKKSDVYPDVNHN
jgi:hypothetical protein